MLAAADDKGISVWRLQHASRANQLPKVYRDITTVRLGDRLVHSIDIAPRLVATARKRLANLGCERSTVDGRTHSSSRRYADPTADRRR